MVDPWLQDGEHSRNDARELFLGEFFVRQTVIDCKGQFLEEIQHICKVGLVALFSLPHAKRQITRSTSAVRFPHKEADKVDLRSWKERIMIVPDNSSHARRHCAKIP